MARCLVVSPDDQLRHTLGGSLASLPEPLLVKFVPRYPQAHEFGRLIDTVKPKVIFLDMCNLEAGSPIARQTLRMMDQMAPGLVRIGFDWSMTPDVLLDSMRAGMRGFVSAPFSGETIQEALTGLGIQTAGVC